MKTNFLTSSAVVLCLLVSLLMIGTNAEAKDTGGDPDNCWYAGIVVYCNSYWSTLCSDGTYDESCGHQVLGPSVGWNVGGGSTSSSCNIALTALMNNAAHAGCTIQSGSPHCYYANNDCPDAPGPGPDDEDP